MPIPLPTLDIPKFPDVPNLPGVPSLSREPGAPGQGADDASPGGGGIDVNFEQQKDAADLSADVNDERWGIYDSDDELVLEPDTIVGVDFSAEARVSDYPVEQGGFASYNKVQSPFDFRFTMAYAGNASERKEFLDKLQELLKDSSSLYKAITPERVWNNITIERYDFRRDARSGVQMLTIDIMAREVRQVNSGAITTQPERAQDSTQEKTTTQTLQDSATQPLDAANTHSPDAADPRNQGRVQAAPPTPEQDAATNYADGSLNDSMGQSLSGNAAKQLVAEQQDPERMRQMGMDRINNPPPGLDAEQTAKYQNAIKQGYSITA